MGNTKKDDKPRDPRQAGRTPPFDAQPQDMPGSEAHMRPKPDHGAGSYKGTGKLQDRVALITGADSGIGKAVALAFAREGADVLIAYLNEEEDARETERLVTQAGRRAVLCPGDVAREQHAAGLVERAFAEFGRLDILVNNAAYQMTHDGIDEISTEEWDYTLRVNLTAMFVTCRTALGRMKPGASIINTASVQAYKPSGTLLPYATTKGAIITFTKALAELAGAQGVRVNAVAPGPVWTPLIPASMPDDKVQHFGEKDIFSRPAQPAELAPAYVYLASNDSSYVTGSVLDVTGGRMLP